jgi:integrase
LTVGDVGEWVAWLRLPGPARQGRVGVLPSVEPAVSERTLQRKLAAVSAFYGFHRRLDPDITLQLTRWDRGFSSAGYQPFLAHTRRQQARQEVRVRSVLRVAPEVIEADDYQALLDGCTRARDQFLLQLLRETGMRIGEALGLRHEDLSIARREVAINPRLNDNGVRVKRWKPRAVPAPAMLFSGYARYLDEEYGDLDSDFVFVNLWAAPRGHAMTYSTARDVLLRLRQRTGLHGFTFHHLRHTYATDLIRKGTDWAIVAHLLGHASVQTTLGTYGHLSVEDARRALVAAGWLTESLEPLEVH